MIYLAASISLMVIFGVTYWAWRPRSGTRPVAQERDSFALSHALLVIGPETNHPCCAAQRTELRRILIPLLQGGYSIVELYGGQPPTRNGTACDWLDNELLRDTLDAKTDEFHLIALGASGNTLFRSGMTMSAEALLHLFDLWDHIDGLAGEALTETGDAVAVQDLTGDGGAGGITPQAIPPVPAAESPALDPRSFPSRAIARSSVDSSVEELRTMAARMAGDDNSPSHPERRRQAPSHIAAMIRRRRP